MADTVSLQAGQTAHRLPPEKGNWLVWVFFLLVAALYLGCAFTPVLFDETEGQYAGAAREMLVRGDWLTPTNDGLPRLQKPPILYWALCASIATFGRTEFAARLPNAIATLGWAWAIYLLGSRLKGWRHGLAAAAIFSSMIGLFIFSHIIMPEPVLGLCITLTMWCFISAYQDPPRARSWFVKAWIFMALGVMVKGLHGALYPLATACVTALLFRGSRVFWRGLVSRTGIAIFLLIVLPWYVVMAIKYPGFLKDHFFNEQFGHFVDARYPRDSEPVPLGRFWLQHVLLFFPWTLFAPAAFWVWWNSRNRPDWNRFSPFPRAQNYITEKIVPEARRYAKAARHYLLSIQPARSQAVAIPEVESMLNPKGLIAGSRGSTTTLDFENVTPSIEFQTTESRRRTVRMEEGLICIWMLLTALTIMFSARQDYYTLTAWGGVALWLALAWSNRPVVPRLYLVIPFLIIAGLGVIGLLWGILSTPPALASPIAVEPEVDRGGLFTSLTSFSLGAWRDCMVLLKLDAVVFLIGGAAAAFFAFRNKRRLAAITLGLIMALLFGSVARGYSLMGSYFSLADAAKAINALAGRDALVVCESEPHLNSSLFFYLDHPVHWVNANAKNEFAIRSLHLGSELYLSEQALSGVWHSPRQVFLITESANIAAWQKTLSLTSPQSKPVARSGTRVVLLNQ